jgi:ASPM-SPD-2-Hydin domain-containing protein
MKRVLLLCAVAALALAAPATAGQKTQTLTMTGPGVFTASVQFGSVPVGGQATATVTLVNATPDPLVVGLHITEFPAGSGFAADTSCADAVQPGDSCDVQVSMTGDETGHYKGKVGLTTFAPCAITPEGCPTGSPDIVIKLNGTTRPR